MTMTKRSFLLSLLGVALLAAAPAPEREPFQGAHQGGIATRPQNHIYFMAFDLTTSKRGEVVALLKAWTQLSARMAEGATAAPLGSDPALAPTDSGDTVGIGPKRLTITVGFGPGLFLKDGVDRYGLAARRPTALVDLPHFPGDQFLPEHTGGDLGVQICSDDAEVSLHAARQLARAAEPVATIRWVQTGFQPDHGSQETPRNLMGFKDGTINIPTDDPAAMAKHVWVGPEGGWLQDGSYMVVRPIRIALEHWDQMKLGFQEEVVGRNKASAAPLGGQREQDPLDLKATQADGNYVLPENCHARLTAPENNDGARILRRGYAYDNGVIVVADRWPPWHQGTRIDAGLLFVCFQRDPQAGFIRIFDKVAKFDMMNQFVTTTGSALFACPAGTGLKGGYLGQALFDESMMNSSCPKITGLDARAGLR